MIIKIDLYTGKPTEFVPSEELSFKSLVRGYRKVKGENGMVMYVSEESMILVTPDK